MVIFLLYLKNKPFVNKLIKFRLDSSSFKIDKEKRGYQDGMFLTMSKREEK